MTYEEFIAANELPDGLSPSLQSLWLAEKGQWEAAHAIAQDIHHETGSLIHANLHRQEGDIGNAGYWYQQAGQPASTLSVDEERRELIKRMLS